MNFVAGVAGKIGAVAAVPGLDKRHIRVGLELGASIRKQANEGIILGVQHKRGNRYLVDHAGAGGVMVVVVGVAETPIAGHDLVVEFAN